MSRKSIFEIVNEKHNLIEEVRRIEELLNDKSGIYVHGDFSFDFYDEGTPTSAIEYIDKSLFKSWKCRGTCIKCSDFYSKIGAPCSPSNVPLNKEISEEEVLLYCEFAANMIYLIKEKRNSKDSITDIITAAENNVKIILSWFNYKLHYIKKEEKVLVVPDNPVLSSVVENRENQALAYKILEYNHISLKGNIQQKKDILNAIANDFESMRKDIKGNSAIPNILENNIFSAFNNLNIRHNNCTKGSSHYNEKVAQLSKKQLEQCYDELYQQILIVYNLLDGQTLIEQFSEFLKIINDKTT